MESLGPENRDRPSREENVRFPMFILLPAASTPLTLAQEHVSFSTEDGGCCYADIYGKGERGVVLAHGGRFDKESWESRRWKFRRPGFA